MSDRIVDERQPPDFDGVVRHESLPSYEAGSAAGGISRDTAQPSFWQSLFNSVFPSRAQREAEALKRLETLDDSIALYPETASNYVLRGEVYLQLNQVELAVLDFQQALELADVENHDWGVVAQAVQDRALHGLKQARRRLQRT